MSLKVVVAALAASAHLTLAVPAGESSIQVDPALRLIKTSEEDPGKWVTSQEKFDLYTSKGIGFIDITNIKDKEVLENLSTKPSARVRTSAVEYPTNVSHVEEANGFIASSNTDGPKSWVDSLAGYFNRHYESETGTEAAAWLFETVSEIASANSAITVEQVQHSFDQPSIIVRLPGNSDELVIIGAHFDSTSGDASDPAPGADDNASGTSVVLESLRVLAKARFAPENTVEFHLYAGEEGGLLGSADVFADYKAQGKTVLAYLNQDMTGYSPSGTPGLVEDYSDPALNTYLTLIVTEYTGKAPNTMDCGYGCSDHASADANGFPASFLFEDVDPNTSPDIHTPQDAPSTIMWDAVERHINFALGFLVEASYL